MTSTMHIRLTASDCAPVYGGGLGVPYGNPFGQVVYCRCFRPVELFRGFDG